MSTPSKVFDFFKKSIDRTAEVKTKLNEKIQKLTETPTVADFREFYSDNEENIQRITNFSRSSLQSVQTVLAAPKRTPISYIHCAGEIRTHYKNNFSIPVTKPAWWVKYCEEWVLINSYYVQFCEHLEKQNRDRLIIQPLPETRTRRNIKTNEKEEKVAERQRIIVGDDFHILWTPKGLMYVSKRNANKARVVIGESFWKEMGDTIEIIHHSEKVLSEVIATPAEEFVDSEKAVQVSKHLEKFLSKGINRTVLFYGPPGTGKSNIVKNVAHRLGKRTLRINFSHIRHCSSFLNDWLLTCKPDVLIIEDIDHAGDGGESALTTLEKMNKSCKMLLATANAVTKLNDAVVRPGRFDELIEINKMDDAVLLKIVGGDEEVFELVKDFPIASTMELMKRIDALGREEALKTIGDIQKRLKNMNSEDCKL